MIAVEDTVGKIFRGTQLVCLRGNLENRGRRREVVEGQVPFEIYSGHIEGGKCTAGEGCANPLALDREILARARGTD